jgi:predicted MFS family arabinose efflux permease
MVALLPVLAGIVITLHTGAVVPFILVSMVTGLAQGCASTGGIRGLLTAAQPSERAGLLSTIHLISYCGAALPGLLAGQLTTTFGMLEIAAGIAALSALAALVSLATTPARPDPR